MRKSERTRQYIIEKVAPVFNKKGYAGTSLTDMTSVTGLTKGSIYGNFQDKNEVALEAFRFNHANILQKAQILIQNQEHAVDKLLAFLRFYKQNYQKIFETGGCAILNTAVDADDGNPLLKNAVIKALESWKSTVEKIISEGVDKNELKTIDGEKFACKMIALVEGSIMISKTTGKSAYLIYNLEALEQDIRSLRK